MFGPDRFEVLCPFLHRRFLHTTRLTTNIPVVVRSRTSCPIVRYRNSSRSRESAARFQSSRFASTMSMYRARHVAIRSSVHPVIAITAARYRGKSSINHRPNTAYAASHGYESGRWELSIGRKHSEIVSHNSSIEAASCASFSSNRLRLQQSCSIKPAAAIGYRCRKSSKSRTTSQSLIACGFR